MSTFKYLLVNKISNESDEILVLGAICPNLGFELNIVRCPHSTPSEFINCKFLSKSSKVLNL